MEHPHPTYLPKHSWTVIAVAAALTALFHWVLYGYIVGLSLVLFALAAVAGVHAIVVAVGRRGNVWAYVFLLPFFMAIVTQAVYAGDSARAVSFLVLVLSFFSFAYWFAAPPLPFSQVRGFWPGAMVGESLLPFHELSKLFAPIARGGAQSRKVLLGVLLAVPFLAVFGMLFLYADALVHKTFADSFSSLFSQKTIAQLFVDVLVLLFTLGTGWTLVTRLMTHRAPKWSEASQETDATIIGTFLGLLNVLFLGFLGFQFVYFFGGEAFLQAQGLTYADYAREGFAQLNAAAVLVFIIMMVLYRMHAFKPMAVRVLSALLIVQTGVISISAIRRLLLYVDAYGLTVARYWALALVVLIIAALILVLIASLMRLSSSVLHKTLVIGALVLVSAVNFVNVEGFVAKVNVDRFLEGSAREIDAGYLLRLSSDAIPSLARLLTSPWPEGKEVFISYSSNPDEDFQRRLEDRLALLQAQSTDWRRMVISDYRALGILSVALK